MKPPEPEPLDAAALARVLLETAPDAIVTIDGASGIVSANAAAERLFGYPAAELVGRPLDSLMPERFRTRHHAGVARYLATGERRIPWQGIRVPVLTREGEEVLVEISFGEFVSNGRRLFSGFLRDVSERAAGERALQEAGVALAAQSRQLDTIARNATLALFIMDEQQRCTYMNPAAERLTGFALAELQGKPLHYYIHHTHPDGTPYPLEECPIDRAFPQNMREQGEEVFVHKDGHFYPVAFTASPIREGERIVGTIIEVRDITAERHREQERERLLRALELERARLTDVFLQAPVAVAVLRGTRAPELVYELVNARYREMLPAGASLDGRRLRDVIPEAGQAIHGPLQQVLDTGEPFLATEFAVPLDRNGDGVAEDYYFNFVYNPLRGADGAVVGIVGVGTEVTDLVLARQVAEEQRAIAEEARVQAESANRAKSEFLATMSHELRTPLNAIAGHVALVLDELHGPVTPAQRDALDRTLRAQRHLLGIINDILNYARLEAGRVEYDLAPVLVRDVLRDILPMVEPQMQAKGLTLDAELPAADGEGALRVLADEEKLGQVLLNLLSNATKFTGRGGTVRVTAAPDRDDPDQVCLHVNDTGMGIPAERLGSIFEPFVQVRTGYASASEGTGLGLAISRDLARGMGGELTASSTLGEGSTFTIQLRRAPTAR